MTRPGRWEQEGLWESRVGLSGAYRLQYFVEPLLPSGGHPKPTPLREELNKEGCLYKFLVPFCTCLVLLAWALPSDLLWNPDKPFASLGLSFLS